MRGSATRQFILLLGTTEAVILASFGLFMLFEAKTSDPIGRSIGQGMALLAAIPLAMLVCPAMVMAYLDRWLRLALGLLVLTALLSAFLWFAA